MEFTMAYNPEMNDIVKRTNGLVISQTRCLLLDIAVKIGQSFQ